MATTTTTTAPPSYVTSEARTDKPSSSKSKDKSSSSSRSKKKSTSSSSKEKHDSEEPTLSNADEKPPAHPVVSDAAEQTVQEVLATFAGESFRRSRCDPEFLEHFARDPTVVSGDDGQEGWEDRVKVICGTEAAAFYKNYLKQHKLEQVDKPEDIPSGNEAAIVFAYVVAEAGRKFVDYYLTWRGKTRVKDLKGAERKPDFLDNEFKRVARKFDKGYKKGQTPPMSTIGTEPIVQSPIEEEAPETPTRKPSKLKRSSSKKKEPVTPTKTSTPEVVAPELPPSPKIPDPPSPGSSVRSLPLLNMIRNVPYGNRVPLRVVNPDLESLASTPRNSIAPRPSLLSLSGLRNSLFGVNLQLNGGEASKEENQRQGTRLETVLEEGSVVDTEESKPEELAGSEAASLNPSTSSNGSARAESVLTKSPSVAEPPPKKKKKTKPKITSEFVIVVLDQHQQKELEKKKKPHTWHGIERKASTKVVPMRAASDSANASSWNAPLVHADGITFSTPPSGRQPHHSTTPIKEKSYLPAYLRRRKRNQQTVPIYIRNSDESDTSGSETDGEPPWMDSPVVPIAPSVMSVMSPDGVISITSTPGYAYPQNGYAYPQFTGPPQMQVPMTSPYAMPVAALSRAGSAVSSTSSSTRSSNSSYVTPFIAPSQPDGPHYPPTPYQAAQATPMNSTSYLTTPKPSQPTLQPLSQHQQPSSHPQQGGYPTSPQLSFPQAQMQTPIHLNPSRLPTPISTQPVYPPSAYTSISSALTPLTPNVNMNSSLGPGHMLGQNGVNGQQYGQQPQQQGGPMYPQSPYVYSIAVPSSAR